MHFFINPRGLTFLLASLIFFQCSPRYGAYFQNTPIENHKIQTKRYLAFNENEPHERLVEPETKNAVEGSPHAFPTDSPDSYSEFSPKPQLERSYQPSEELVLLAEQLVTTQNKVESEEDHAEKKELHKVQKQLKKDLRREVKKEARQIKNQKIWIGVVIGVAGLLISILASGSIGAIAIIVGIGFIAWGLIEQGGL